MQSQIHLLEGNQSQTSSTEEQIEEVGAGPKAAWDLPAAAKMKELQLTDITIVQSVLERPRPYLFDMKMSGIPSGKSSSSAADGLLEYYFATTVAVKRVSADHHCVVP